jgi:hypothetical protein
MRGQKQKRGNAQPKPTGSVQEIAFVAFDEIKGKICGYVQFTSMETRIKIEINRHNRRSYEER